MHPLKIHMLKLSSQHHSIKYQSFKKVIQQENTSEPRGRPSPDTKAGAHFPSDSQGTVEKRFLLCIKYLVTLLCCSSPNRLSPPPSFCKIYLSIAVIQI